MPQLYFKIGSDWAEVVRLRQEIARLESQLHQFNGNAPLKVLDKLCDELSAAKTRMQALLDDAAIAGKKLEDAFKASVKIDLSTPEGQLKAFDAQVQKMCSSLDTYFENVKGKLRELQSLMGDGQTIAGNIKVNDGNVRRIEEMKRQNAELQEQIQRQTEEIERQQQQWQQLADAVRNNNVAAIQQLSQQTDEATRRLRMDAAKGSINGITEELNEMAEKMAVAEGKAEALKAILDDLRNRKQNGDATIADSSIADAEQSYQKANEELKKMKAEYNSMSAEQKKYVDQLKDASGHHVRMRTQIIDAREKMAQLIAAGQTGTPAFRQLAEQAAVMRRQITLANATMQYFSNPTRHLETLKVAMQGAAGAAGLVTGLFGIFNTESEKMAQIQTKVQSALAIVVGLETTYATVKKTSNVMMAVSEFQAWAATKAKLAEAAATNAGTLATIKATAAQRAFNLVASMNPYVLLATAIGALGVALFSFTKSAKTATEAEKELTKAQEEQRKVNEKLGSSVGDTIAEYMLMQKQWESLSTAHEKNSWIDENKTKFKQMGLTIGDINTAEKVFVDHSKEVIAALKARAEAEAWGEIYKERIKKKAENDMNGSIANGRYLENFHAGDRVNVGKLRQTYGKTVNTNTVGGSEGYFRVDGTHFGTSYSDNEFVRLTEESARDLNAKALEMANAITKAEDDAIELAGQQMDEAQKRAAEAQLDLQRKIGNSGIGSGNDTSGKSPDEIVRMQMQQEQEAIRQRQQNLLLQEQAVIDQMQDGTEKELAQMRLNHKKRMLELDSEEQDILNKKIESASRDKKGNPIKGFYTSGKYMNVHLSDDDRLGVNSQRISENEAYADKMIAIFKKIEGGTEASMKKMELLESAYSEVVNEMANMGDSETASKFIAEAERLYRESMLEINRERLSNLYDYLKEFGTVQQQMYAIEKSYDDKIAKEQDPIKKQMLERQKQSQMASVNAQNLAMGIDWSTAFEGVGNVLSDIAKETLQKVEAYMQTTEFKGLGADKKKSYVELRDQLRNETGGNSTSAFNFKIWGTIEQNVKDYQASIKKLKSAQEAHNAAIEDLKQAERDMEAALKSGSKTQIDAAKAVLEAAQDAVNVTADDQTDAKDKSEEAKKKLAENTEKAANGIQNFANYVNEMADGSLSGFANGISKLVTSLSKGSDGVGKSLGELGGKIGGIIGAILQIIDALGDDPAQFIEDLLDKIAAVTEKVLEDLPQIIGSVLEGVGNIVGGVVQGVGNLFGADLSGIFGGGTENFDAAVEKWGWLLDTWKDNLEYEKTLMKEAYGTKVTDIQQKTEADLRRTQQAAAEIYRGWASDGAGWFSHSNGYNANEDANWRYLWDYDQELAKRMGARELQLLGNSYISNGSIENLFNLTAKELKELKYNNSQFWQSLHGEAQKYLDQIIEAEEEIEQLRKEAMEQLTATSFDTLVSDFQSALANMDSDAEDFADNFEKYMQNAVLSALVAEKYKPAIEQWYKMFAAMMEDGILTEQETEQLHNGGYFTNPTTGEQEYSQGWDDISASGLRDRDALKNQFNWGDDSSKQEADKKGFAAMSQDTGEELNGRFTALQIAGENISAQMNAVAPIIVGIGNNTVDIKDMVDGIGRVADDMLSNIVECYTELNLIRFNTDDLVKIGKDNQQTLKKMASDLKRI